LASLKDLYFLRHGSMLIITVVSYATLVVIFQTPSYVSANISDGLYSQDLVLAEVNMSAFSTFALAIFSFACHVLIFPVQNEVGNANPRRMEKIIRRAVIVEFIVYMSMGVCGYISIVTNVPDVIVYRNSLVYGSHDTVMNIARCALIASPVIAIPIKMNPTRLQFYLLTGMQESPAKRLMLTAAVLVVSGGIAVVFPDIYAALTILAGTVGCLINFSVPALIYITERPNYDFKKIAAIVINILGTLGGFLGAAYSLLSVIGINT